MSLEQCPYCGKPFKRLKSHLPHCKMAPFAQAMKSTQTPQDLSKKNAITSKQKFNKKILTEKNHFIFDDRQTSIDRRKEELIVNKSVHNAESSIATTEVTSFVNTERPQSKWSAKIRKEHDRLEQLAVLQKSINYTSVSDHERDKIFQEMSNGQEKGESQTNGTPTKAKKKTKVAPLSEPLSNAKSTTTMPAILKSPNLSSEWSLCGENPKFTVMAEIEPNAQSNDLNLVSRVEELKPLTLFTSKTSVWDHVNGSLYYKRSCNLLLPSRVLGIHKASDFETKCISVTTQLSKKLENTKPITPSVHFSKTSIQRPMKDVHSSRLQSLRSLGWNPEIMTSFRVLFSTEPFRNSSNDTMWKKHLFSEPTSHSEVPLIQRKLADVRLKELGIWLGDQSPKSPGEFGTVLKQGWQWYYTKYIDIRRGGIGGISLLLAGYCVLSYIWRYPDLKKERWRKYH